MHSSPAIENGATVKEDIEMNPVASSSGRLHVPASQEESPLNHTAQVDGHDGPTCCFPQVRAKLKKRDWVTLAAVAGAVAGLHVVGWGLLAVVVPRGYRLRGGEEPFGYGVGVTAYTLGMRHAFDADHIAAIDNATRKFLADGQRAFSVGFWFALGHSSVVLVAAVLITAGFKTFASQVSDGNSRLQRVTGIVGTSVSGSFLVLIGVINLIVLIQLIKVFRAMRTKKFTEKQLEEQLDKRGFLNRILACVSRLVRAPWHMYPLGFLFGLGFDTATEVALLFLAAGAASGGLPWAAVLALPLLFAAGMTLLDAADGALAAAAYSWALAHPVRRLFYNIVITALAVVVALGIGLLELMQLVIDKAHLSGAPWSWIAAVNLNYVGFGIVGFFAITWPVAIAVWRFGGFSERWVKQPPLSPIPEEGDRYLEGHLEDEWEQTNDKVKV